MRSAAWSVNGLDDPSGYSASAEGGSFGFARGSAAASAASSGSHIAGAVGWQRSTGIDSFGAPDGDKDGFRNLSGRARGTFTFTPEVRMGAAGFALTGHSEFDGYDAFTFEHADTKDNTRNRLAAARVWVEAGNAQSLWSGRVAATMLNSSNRNFIDVAPINRTSGARRTLDAQVERGFVTGTIQHRLIVAAEAEREAFHARGLSSGLPTDQDRSRTHQAIAAEWRGSNGHITGDVAVRRDLFNRFADTTTVRGSLLAELGGGLSLGGSYAEGMAQPTFFDLYGTFPNNFVGNPNLEPETSRGFEGSLRFRRANLSVALTAFRQRLYNEVIDVFDLATFQSSTQNSTGVSRRAGLEAQSDWQVARNLRLRATYAYLHATQPESSTGLQVRERRRPKHRASLAGDGSSGRWSYGASIAYAGPHIDTLEVAPFGPTRVKSYWLADARVAYSVRPDVQLFARGSNLLNSDYQEVAGYHTEGIGGFVGIRLADRRSSP